MAIDGIDRLQALLIGVAVVFLLAVLDLVRRRKLVEEYAYLWIAVGVLMLVVSIWRELLHEAAHRLGVYDPPNVLLIALTMAVLVALLKISVVLSRQRRQIDRLIEEVAILDAELRTRRSPGDRDRT